jgi:hypothetical protein
MERALAGNGAFRVLPCVREIRRFASRARGDPSAIAPGSDAPGRDRLRGILEQAVPPREVDILRRHDRCAANAPRQAIGTTGRVVEAQGPRAA